MRSVFHLIIFLFAVGALHAQTAKVDPDYGLAFASHEVSTDHRTALNLNPGEPYRFNKDFEITFDLAFQRLINAYGYIIRIVANDSLNIDLVSSPEHNEFHDLTLIINNKPTGLHYEFSDIGLKALQWTTLKLAFSYNTNQVTFAWNGKEKIQPFTMNDLKTFRFYFGVNDFGKFNTSDAPPVILKNVRLLQDRKVIHEWKLKKHNVTEVFDSVGGVMATVKNPEWLIDRHTKWVHRKNFSIGRFPSVAFNGEAGVLYAIDEKNLYTYDLSREKLDKTAVAGGNPVYTDANQLLYVRERNTLINYDVFTSKFITYHFGNNRWENTDTTYNLPNYWHNNKFYNPFDSALYTFGGYGHFTYKNNFFRYDEKTDQWATVSTTGSIPPRYLAASGLKASTNQILIFGGYGSESGKQELSPQCFYDLYTFDLRDHSVNKEWELPVAPASEDIVFANSMVVNEKQNCFYVLSFPKNKYKGFIKLRQYTLDKPEERILADSIPFQFHDEHSFSDLFLSEATNELIAVTAHKEKDQYQVQVYSIRYPPLQAQDVLQSTGASPMKASVYLIVFGAFAVVGLLLLFVWKRKKRLAETTVPVTAKEPEPVDNVSEDTNILHPEPKLLSTILLFGGFQVFDRKGEDISRKFTMTLKDLFALIVLHSVKFEKGISAVELQEYLWPDKDEVSARNNRNVNIKKLRTLLEEIGDMSIENNNAYLRLNMDDHVFCDYQSVYKLLNSDRASQGEREKIQCIIKSVKRGSLLPNLQATWLDNFKDDISNQVIDTLLEYAQKLDPNKDDKLLIEIADCIFNYDSINQEALVIKCSVLNKKGKYSLARIWYDHFVKEYKNLYAENYPKSFEEVISQVQAS